MDKKLTKLKNCFNHEACKAGENTCGRCGKYWDEGKTQAAEVLTNTAPKQPIKCAPENCWECPSLLC